MDKLSPGTLKLTHLIAGDVLICENRQEINMINDQHGPKYGQIHQAEIL